MLAEFTWGFSHVHISRLDWAVICSSSLILQGAFSTHPRLRGDVEICLVGGGSVALGANEYSFLFPGYKVK